MPSPSIAVAELTARSSRRLAQLRRFLPLTLLLCALALFVEGYALTAPAPLLAAACAARYLRRLDPSGLRLRASATGVTIAGSGAPLRCRARFDDLLWLESVAADGAEQSLLLFSDALDDRQWRLLRRGLALAEAAPSPERRAA